MAGAVSCHRGYRAGMEQAYEMCVWRDADGGWNGTLPAFGKWVFGPDEDALAEQGHIAVRCLGDRRRGLVMRPASTRPSPR